MTPKTPTPIQQQMYTRERHGIFRSTEGYDTIAKSDGLDPNFVKKVLHPFCVYDAPAELTARGEKDEAAYPKAVHLFHTDTGQMVLGCSAYLAADFTGLRSAFFSHNYVIPAERAAEAAKDYASLLNASFAESYDIETGMSLPELDRLPASAEPSPPASPAELLASLGIDEKLFKQLLFAIMSSVATKRKVYVALDVPVESISENARQLLGVLYASLPYTFRSVLGFITYAMEPQSKKGIHLTFVEQGSLRPNDRNVDKDYTFDLASQRVTNVDIDFAKQPFLNFAWANVGRPERADSFYQFAERMLADMDPKRHTAIASYHELAVFFQIEEGNEALYDANRSMVLRSMLEYLSPEGALAAKERLNELFLGRFNREFGLAKQRQVPDLSIVKCFKEYNELDGADMGNNLIGYLICAIYNAVMEKGKERGEAFYGLIESEPELSRAFFDTVLRGGKAKELFEPYIQHKFHAAQKAIDVVQLAHHWSSTHPLVLRDDSFVELAATQLVEKLRREAEPVAAVNEVLERIARLPIDDSRSSGASHAMFMERLSYAANVFLLTDLDLEQVRKEPFLQIQFLQHPHEVKQWVARFNQQVQNQAAVMLSAYRWFSERDPDPAVFDDLSLTEMDRVQQLGRRWLQKEIEPSQFGRLVLAFYREADKGLVEYGALLHYLSQHAPDKETVYQFMNWSEKHPLFAGSRKLIPAYATAIVAYFKKYDRDAFKKRTNRHYFAQAGAALQAVYDKARLELSSPFMKLIRRNRKASLFSLAAVVVIGGTLIGLLAAGGFEKDKPVLADKPADDAKTQGDAQTTADKQPAVFARDTEEDVDGVKKTATELVFDFGTAAECTAFQAKTIIVKLDDGTERAFTDKRLQHACASAAGAAETPPADAAGGAMGSAADASSPASQDSGDAEAASGADNAAGSNSAPEMDAAQPAAQPSGEPLYQVVVPLGEQLTLANINQVIVDDKLIPYIVK
ncbi:glycosyltransferase [Paenibacillus apiarius]|uniref:GAP1-N2 domain-containing protein n=1 Tax=Paenibacillus apiarius TaxID=46240 RepID=UPI003B3B4CEB